MKKSIREVTRKRLILPVVLLLLATTQPQSVISGPQSKANMQIQQLSKATRLESQLLGEGAEKSKSFASFKELAEHPDSFTEGDLMWLKANGTPASKVYAAFLMGKKDAKLCNHYFLEFLDNDTELQFQSGCEVIKTSISAIGRSVIATGKYLDFEGTVPGTKPIYFQELTTAKLFADNIGSESGRHLEYLVFAAALEHAKQLNPKDLEELVKSPSAAGRIYAAVLQDASGKFKKNAALEKLLQDKAKVNYISGCKMSEYSVGEIAKELAHTGKFHNFRPGVQ